jgi:membrane protease YdiL (CAAX protease family)
LDVSKFRVGDWVVVAAGATMLVLGLAVPWAGVTYRGVDLGGARNAFDYPWTGGLAWLLVVAAGVVTFLRAARLVDTGGVPWSRLVVLGTALAVVLLVVRIVLGPGDDSRADLARGPGMVVALLAAIGALVGAVMDHRAEGAPTSDLWSFGSRRTVAPGRAPDLPPPTTVREDMPPPPPG